MVESDRPEQTAPFNYDNIRLVAWLYVAVGMCLGIGLLFVTPVPGVLLGLAIASFGVLLLAIRR
jgi:hypothetical protein